MMNLLDSYQLLHKGIEALSRAESQGIRVDMDVALKHNKQIDRKIKKLEETFYTTDFYKHWEKSIGGRTPNIGSNDQLARFLYTVKKIKPTKLTASSKGSVDDEALSSLNIPELNDLLAMRKLKKLRDTYLKAFIQESHDGVIHPVFNLHTTVTYRSSSDSPNFQNIPIRDEESKKVIRTCLFPRIGHRLVEVDFSQIEVRVAACYHKDPTMQKYIEDPTTDMHGDMAEQIYKIKYDKKIEGHHTLRQSAKNAFVFPQFYGDYYGNNAVGLSGWTNLPLQGKYKDATGIILGNTNLGAHLRSKGLDGFESFKDHLRKIESHFWKKRFPVYARWKDEWYAEYQKTGQLKMKTGFICKGVMSKNDVINYPVQGAAFHCLLWSFIRIDQIFSIKKMRSKLIGQIHDSILIDAHPDELEDVLRITKTVMEVQLVKEWKWITVPLVVEAEVCGVDESWYYKKGFDISGLKAV